MMVEITVPTSVEGHLRRLDVRRDLARVADLVELCFYDTLDPEGKQYLNDMRKAAQSPSMMKLAGSLIEETALLPSGYVWEEDGRLVGNLNLIPITVRGKRGYMIANVATHPDYRGRGIATALTQTALRHAEQHGTRVVWLQVREDNPSAIHIYLDNGFIERFRRTSWYSLPSFPPATIRKEMRVINRHTHHWTLQREWLSQSYPADLSWNLPFDWNSFRPDMWGMLYRAFMLEFPRHWSVERSGKLQGVLTWKHSTGMADPLWLAVPKSMDDAATLALLLIARSAIRKDQPLSLNFAANTAVEVIRQAGFYPQQTLIWMQLDRN